MEKLLISVPDKKSALVKQILESLGVIIQQQNPVVSSTYREKILTIPTLTEEDMKSFDDAKGAFEGLKPQPW